MYAVIGILSLVGSIPAMWLGMKMVVAFDLPFVAFCLPVLACIAVSGWAIARAEKEMAR